MLQDEIYQGYTIEERHWHVLSEQYTGVDSLLTLLNLGGQILDDIIYYQRFPLSVSRQVKVFHIYVRYNKKIEHMKIIDSPHLYRLLSAEHVNIRHLESSMTLQSLEMSHHT